MTYEEQVATYRAEQAAQAALIEQYAASLKKDRIVPSVTQRKWDLSMKMKDK